MEDWKKSYIFGTLVICPPKKVCSIVDALREKYDPLSQAIMGAHITLTQPFLKEPTPQVWKEINKILSEFEIFPITYGPIETFPSSSVIKFKIQQQNQILSLRNKLHQTGYFNLELPFTEGFIAHMTISELVQRKPSAAKELANQLNKDYDEGSFICKEISYIRPDDDFHFQIKKVFQIGER